MQFLYLGALLFSILGMGILDKRLELAFFHNARRTLITVAIGMITFVVWDLLGIQLGVFFVGPATITTGVMIAPELPLEELFFLFFLCYFTLCMYRLLEKTWRRISS